MFMHRVTNPFGSDTWYGFHRDRDPGGPDTHLSWDRICYATSFTKVHGAYRGDMKEILSEFNPVPRHLDSLLTRALCCVLALRYYDGMELENAVNELLIELGI